MVILMAVAGIHPNMVNLLIEKKLSSHGAVLKFQNCFLVLTTVRNYTKMLLKCLNKSFLFADLSKILCAKC